MTFEHIQTLCRRLNARPWQQKVLHEELADSPWHTGTPTEEGIYILLTDFQIDGLSSSAGTYTLDYWDGYSFKYLRKEAEMNAVFKPNMYSWVAWQKITPFVASKEK